MEFFLLLLSNIQLFIRINGNLAFKFLLLLLFFYPSVVSSLLLFFSTTQQKCCTFQMLRHAIAFDTDLSSFLCNLFYFEYSWLILVPLHHSQHLKKNKYATPLNVLKFTAFLLIERRFFASYNISLRNTLQRKTNVKKRSIIEVKSVQVKLNQLNKMKRLK